MHSRISSLGVDVVEIYRHWRHPSRVDTARVAGDSRSPSAEATALMAARPVSDGGVAPTRGLGSLALQLGRLWRRGLWVVSTLDGDVLSYWAAVEALRALYVRAGVCVPQE